jgi:hypothetical protein
MQKQKKANPFELQFSKPKHAVLNRKTKGTLGKPAASRKKSYETVIFLFLSIRESHLCYLKWKNEPNHQYFMTVVLENRILHYLWKIECLNAHYWIKKYDSLQLIG